MERHDGEALGRFAREHHVHYEVEREEASDARKTELVGFAVRLFATHGEQKVEPPTCPRCLELVRELSSFAQDVLASGDTAARAEIAPATPAVYQSTEVPGANEVSVAVRVHCHAPEHRGGEDRCIGDLRQRLEALGVPRR